MIRNRSLKSLKEEMVNPLALSKKQSKRKVRREEGRRRLRLGLGKLRRIKMKIYS